MKKRDYDYSAILFAIWMLLFLNWMQQCSNGEKLDDIRREIQWHK